MNEHSQCCYCCCCMCPQLLQSCLRFHASFLHVVFRFLLMIFLCICMYIRGTGGIVHIYFFIVHLCQLQVRFVEVMFLE